MIDLVSKSAVLDIYAELYDVFDDNKAIQEELSKVYDKLRRLKGQEPVAPTHSYSTYRCGKCGYIVGFDAPGCKSRYCSNCGRWVKWE